MEVSAEPLAVSEIQALVSTVSQQVHQAAVRHHLAPFLQDNRYAAADPAEGRRRDRVTAVALSVLPVLPDDLSDDVDDQHIHDHRSDKGHNQRKRLREKLTAEANTCSPEAYLTTVDGTGVLTFGARAPVAHGRAADS